MKKNEENINCNQFGGMGGASTTDALVVNRNTLLVNFLNSMTYHLIFEGGLQLSCWIEPN